MRTRRRFLATCVVIASSMIAACVGYLEHLSSTAQEAVTLNGSSFTFADTFVGDTSGPITVIVSPTSGGSNSDDTINAITLSNCGDFSVTQPHLPAQVFRHCDDVVAEGSNPAKPGHLGEISNDDSRVAFAGSGTAQLPSCQSFMLQTASIPVTFHPKSAGNQTCSITLVGSFGSKQVSMNGLGKLPDFDIAVDKNPIPFGDIRVGGNGQAAVALSNAGAMPLHITSIDFNNGGGIYTTTENLGVHDIPFGGADVFNVTCTPTGPNATPVAGSLTIHSNASKTPTLAINFTCRGIDSKLDTTPGSPVAIQNRVGETTLIDPFTITNTGNQGAQIDALSIAGTTHVVLTDLSGQPVALPIGLGSGAHVDLKLSYHSTEPEDVAGNLVVTHDGGKVDNIGLSTSALETTFGKSVGDTIDFGPVCQGVTQSMPVAIYAGKPGGFSFSSVTLPGAPYAWTGPSTGSLDGDHVNEIAFMASVTPAVEGPINSMVTFATDIPDAGSQVIMLTTEGLGAGTTARPLQTDFVEDLGKISLKKFVKFTNCTAGDVMVTGARIDGEAAGDFGIVGPDPLARTLHQGEAVEIEVVMAPTGLPGPRVATLVIESSDGETPAELDGTGVGDAPPADEDPEDSTYYHCSAGGSGGVFVGFAVLGLLRRRRRR